jgi:hypothetical protein
MARLLYGDMQAVNETKLRPTACSCRLASTRPSLLLLQSLESTINVLVLCSSNAAFMSLANVAQTTSGVAEPQPSNGLMLSSIVKRQSLSDTQQSICAQWWRRSERECGLTSTVCFKCIKGVFSMTPGRRVTSTPSMSRNRIFTIPQHSWTLFQRRFSRVAENAQSGLCSGYIGAVRQWGSTELGVDKLQGPSRDRCPEALRLTVCLRLRPQSPQLEAAAVDARGDRGQSGSSRHGATE